MNSTGTCFGYTIRTDLDLAFLRDGAGAEDLLVEVAERDPVPDSEPLLEWVRPAFPFAARLHGPGPRFDLWVEAAGWFAIDADVPAIRLPAGGPELRREERLWGMPTLLCFAARGDLPLHAAAVDIDGAAVVLAAPSRFGKTTLAAALVAAGHRLLAEDLTCVRLGAAPSVVPGPAMLRVRIDIADRLGLAGTVELGRDDDRLHLALEPSRRGTGDPVPLRAVVLLREHEAPPRLERTDTTQALADLWTVSFKLPTEEDRARSFTQLADLTAAIGVHDLHRRLDLDSLVPTVALLEDLARG